MTYNSKGKTRLRPVKTSNIRKFRLWLSHKIWQLCLWVAPFSLELEVYKRTYEELARWHQGMAKNSLEDDALYAELQKTKKTT